MTGITEMTTSLEPIAQANNHLAVHLHRLLAESEENVFFSPLSISITMAMLFCAARSDTKTEMSAVLGYNISDSVQEKVILGFQHYISNVMKTTDSYSLSCANSLLIQEDFKIKEKYKTLVEDYFYALLVKVNFQSDMKSIPSQINSWVKEKTHGMIPSLIQSPLDPETVMVLLNAVYFKGSWLHKFNKDSTSQRFFFNHGTNEMAKKVDMMQKREVLPYIARESFSALKLPYNGGNISMLILLPKTRDGLKVLEKELSGSFVCNLIEDMRKIEVIVKIPRFSLRYSKSLVPYFQKLGINRLFRTGAQFGEASDSTNLVVSEILHEAVLEVNEDGSKAAAATKIKFSRKSGRPPHYALFSVDRPFIFTIYDEKNKIILFLGRVIKI